LYRADLSHWEAPRKRIRPTPKIGVRRIPNGNVSCSGDEQVVDA
jgi:hypothetical protein